MKYIDIADWNATSFTKDDRVTITNGEEVLSPSVDTIVIHHWGDDNQSFEKVCEFFAGGPGTSAHFVVEAGRCAQLVEIKDIAWHAGNWAANQRSIGIECRPEMSAEDFETVAQVIADIETYYGRSFYIHGHKDFFNTACPGRWYDQLDRLIDRINAIKERKGEQGEAVPAPLPAVDVERIRAEFAELDKQLREAVEAGKQLGETLDV
ncbi:peptidoglycan recognition protein family protein [Rothia mucilaginosa]|uniref:peptidoglycan recognition protein family protein n=1 Tax=Rothia mucilaginosa TaxID=43675 RepID=UPI003C71AE98